jgi:hypothetical protein
MTRYKLGTAGRMTLLAAWLFAGAGGALACVEGDLRGDMITAKREFGALPQGEAATFHMLGAGWFRAAEIVKHGGETDQTYVTLELDGVPMFTTSFAALKNPWMQISNSYIVFRVETEGDTSTMTIWYSPELKFRAMVSLNIDVREVGVGSVQMSTVMNKPAPHEHPAGTGSLASALPAFE